MLPYHTECNQLQLFVQIICYGLSTTRDTGLTVYRTAPTFNDLAFQMTIRAVRGFTKLNNSLTVQT
jgi:hypothetical protein